VTTTWTLTRKAGPQSRPVSLAEAKASLRLSQSDTTHDDNIGDLIDAATEQIEQDTDRAVINQDFDYQLNAFPGGRASIVIAPKPASEILAITYLDSDGVEQTLDPATYQLDKGRREVYLNSGESWPNTLAQQNAVTVSYRAGYGASQSNVPRLIRQAILLMVGSWFTDPTMEFDKNDPWNSAYGRIITRLIRTSYP